jgi:hypothetical protein
MAPIALILAVGCVSPRPPEDPADWTDAGDALDVEEPVSFTDEAYGLDGGIGAIESDVFPTADDTLVYAPGDGYAGSSDCDWAEDADLPMEITGIVTIDPRFYFKTVDCTTDDEKYYGSFFLEDDDGAVFVLGDSKVAHFGIGDTVTLRVRGAHTRFDLDMVQTWDLVSVDPTHRAIHYEQVFNPLVAADIAKVRRVEGTVATTPDTFGEFILESDEGTSWFVQIDAELNRRGFTITAGERLQITGPVLYAYSQYDVVVMRGGQVTRLDP